MQSVISSFFARRARVGDEREVSNTMVIPARWASFAPRPSRTLKD